jgi:hypothetical protein
LRSFYLLSVGYGGSTLSATKVIVKVYLSGPISLGGTASPEQVQHYKEAFHVAALALYDNGHLPLSPLENEASSWEAYMRKAIAQMMSADSVLMLPDWRLSNGAVIEHNLALAIGIPIKYSDES